MCLCPERSVKNLLRKLFNGLDNYSMNGYHLFNRDLLAKRRSRFRGNNLSKHPLHRAIQDILRERLTFVHRSFETVALMGDIPFLSILHTQFPQSIHLSSRLGKQTKFSAVVSDPEFLPLPEKSMDLLISYFDLQAVNDIPGTLLQIRHVLKPDGLFLGVFLGGDSLWELRQVCAMAEEITRGGVSPRVAPMVSVHDAALLMQRAGFALPVIDHECMTHAYSTPLAILQDLRVLQLTNILYQQEQGLMGKRLFQEIQHQYLKKFKINDEVNCTYDVLFLSGWGPADCQQRPLIPGSGKVLLEHVL